MKKAEKTGKALVLIVAAAVVLAVTPAVAMAVEFPIGLLQQLQPRFEMDPDGDDAMLGDQPGDYNWDEDNHESFCECPKCLAGDGTVYVPPTPSGGGYAGVEPSQGVPPYKGGPDYIDGGGDEGSGDQDVPDGGGDQDVPDGGGDQDVPDGGDDSSTQEEPKDDDDEDGREHLPYTGGNTLLPVIIGGLAMAIGAALVVVPKVRRRS